MKIIGTDKWIKELDIELQTYDGSEGDFCCSIFPKFVSEMKKLREVCKKHNGFVDEVMENDLQIMECKVRDWCEDHDEYYQKAVDAEAKIHDLIYKWNEENIPMEDWCRRADFIKN
jgi:hypothetical protein